MSTNGSLYDLSVDIGGIRPTDPSAADDLRHPTVPTALWSLQVPQTALEELDLAVLDAEEARRTASFARLTDRLRYAAAHILLRKVLGAVTGAPPQELAFSRDPCLGCGADHGRPRLARSAAPEFSLSHGGSLVLVGVSAAPIGVDVEPVPRLATAERLASVLHPDEQAQLQALPSAHRPLMVARIWTRKEAYLKGIGTGLERDPDADYLGVGPQIRSLGAGEWSFPHVPVAAGYAAALAVRGRLAARSVAPRELPSDLVIRG